MSGRCGGRYDDALTWLLRSDEPAVRFLARRDLLAEVSAEDAEQILGRAEGTGVVERSAGRRWLRRTPVSQEDRSSLAALDALQVLLQADTAA